MNFTENTQIGELVASDYRFASVFQSFGIDYCCNGNRTISDACKAKELDEDEVIYNLQSILMTDRTESIDFKNSSLSFLAEYIETKHHKYVETKIPELQAYLNKIVDVHGASHPELAEINALFTASSKELTAHMKKEELILFPYIKKLNSTEETKSKVFETVEVPIEMMYHEHDTEGERFRQIEKLSNNYTPPSDACNTYKVTFALLKEFQEDLHLHIHLENNILFPKAIALEKRMRN